MAFILKRLFGNATNSRLALNREPSLFLLPSIVIFIDYIFFLLVESLYVNSLVLEVKSMFSLITEDYKALAFLPLLCCAGPFVSFKIQYSSVPLRCPYCRLPGGCCGPGGAKPAG